MAFASIGSLGVGNSIISGTTVAAVFGTAAAAGDLVVAIIGKDNVQTTDGETSEVSSITDSVGGNTWLKAGEYCNGQTGAGLGAVVSVWYSVLTNAIGIAGVITANFASAITAKAITAWGFTKGAGTTIEVLGPPQFVADDAIDATALVISALASAEYLFLRGIGSENITATITPTASYTAITTSVADTTVAGTSINTKGEFRILTGTGDTSNPAATGNTDKASVYFALHEVAAAGGNIPVLTRQYRQRWAA